jgi:hypothetical protein
MLAVTHRHPDEKAGQQTAGCKAHIPHLPPPAHWLLAAELDGYGAE